MKRLSVGQASACENATTPRCRCRCGGLLHGVKRGIPVTRLPPDDPHHAEEEDPQLELGGPVFGLAADPHAAPARGDS